MINYARRLPPGKRVSLIDEFTVRKTVVSDVETILLMKNLINHCISTQPSHIVTIYNFSTFRNGKFISYEYDMERLGILTPLERELINIVGKMHKMHGKEACYQKDISYNGSKIYPKLFEFLKHITDENLYKDIHSGNILMDHEFNYRIIDLEGFLVYPLNSPFNLWIENLPTK